MLDPGSATDRVADVLVADGVARIGSGDTFAGVDAQMVDIAGQLVVPGLVDLRTHLREPGEEHKETLQTGLRAAAAGGFTTVCAMPGTRPPNDSRAVTEMLVQRGAEVPGARLLPFAAITRGIQGRELTDMAELRDAGAVGVTDDRWPITDAGLLRRALEYADTFGLLLMQHCEEPALVRGALAHEGVVSTRLGLRGWPRQAEDAAVARDLRVAELTGARLHIAHVSSAGAVALIREAKAQGVRVTCDVTPHHLTYTDQAIATFDPMFRVVPPLREESDRQALLGGVRDGTLDVITTDHAPHHALAKECEFEEAAPGMAGLETALPLVLALVDAGDLPLDVAIAALSTRPAEILGRAQPLEGGGDVTVIDPAKRWRVEPARLRSKGKNTPLVGAEVAGAATWTLVGGRVVHTHEERHGA